MTLFMTLLLYGAVAIGFFLLVDGASWLAANSGDRGQSRVNRRLGFGNADPEEKIERLAREENATASSLGGFFQNLIDKAQSRSTPERIYAIIAGLTILVTALLVLFAPHGPLAFKFLLALFIATAIPIFHLKNMARKRVRKIQEQLPDALDLVVRSLRIGHPLSAALQTIANEMPQPLSGEFGIAARQVVYGKTPPEAVGALASRVGLPDLRFFAVAVQIHHEAGGNLAEILAGLSKIIRSRFQLFRKVNALTVEGRFSAWFLSLFPVVMMFAMNMLQPGYYEKVMDYAYFPHLVALTIFLLIINVIAMRMMTKLEV
jgi:tight adherence protein B